MSYLFSNEKDDTEQVSRRCQHKHGASPVNAESRCLCFLGRSLKSLLTMFVDCLDP
jgi:hypothetical protein